MTAIAINASSGPWGDNDFCARKRVDPSTKTTHISGMCVEVGSGDERREIACWRPDKGWISEDFAKTPVARIKGWLELTNHCLTKAAHTEGCDSLTMLRMATDTYAAIEQITARFSVHWHPEMLRLFNGMKDTTKRISDSLVVDPNDGSDQWKVSKRIEPNTQDGRSIRNLAVTSDMLSKSVDKDSDAIQLPIWLDINKISVILEAVALGAVYCGPLGVTVALYIEAIVAIIQGIGFLIPIINGVIHWVKHIFGF